MCSESRKTNKVVLKILTTSVINVFLVHVIKLLSLYFSVKKNNNGYLTICALPEHANYRRRGFI